MIDMEQYGFKPSLLTSEAMGTPGRITAVHRERFQIICPHGTAFGRLKSSIYYEQNEPFPTVGDFVLIQYQEIGDSLILKTFPRYSFFSRRDPTPGRGEQAVAANFDTVFVMTSLNRDFNLGRLERYLTSAWQSGATPVVVLTKADLSLNYERQVIAVQNVAPGVDIIPVSSSTGFGLDILATYLLPGKTVVFLGSSGVGKSSLVNALSGEMVMDVRPIREEDSRGRHTTTHRQLFMLPTGAMIIDTPGMRELGMWDVTSGLGAAFSDVEEIISRGCRFTDCNHQTEPGCSVLQALESGELSRERWQSYTELKNEAEYSDNKREYLHRRTQERITHEKHLRKSGKFKK